LENKARMNSSYNVTNDLDPFVSEDLIKNLMNSVTSFDPPYTQKVLLGAFANLDLVPTVGWDGLYTGKYNNPGHPMRSFGLNHVLQQFPVCNSLPEGGVNAVKSEYVEEFTSECQIVSIKVPKVFGYFVYFIYLIFWPPLVLFALTNLRQAKILFLPIIWLFVYSFLGAGISRYAMPIYPLLIVSGYLNFYVVAERMHNYVRLK